MSSIVPTSFTCQNHGNTTPFGSVATGLPQALEVYNRPNSNFEIKPAEVGGIGYGLGRALRIGFESLSSKVSILFRSMEESLPQLSLFSIRGASAREISKVAYDLPMTSEKKKFDQKHLGQKTKVIKGCQKTIMGNCSLPWSGSVRVSGRIGCIAAFFKGVQVVEISDPWRPYVIGSFNNTKWVALDLAILKDRVYCAFGNAGLQVLSLKNPRYPEVIGFYNSTECKYWNAQQVEFSGKYIYTGFSGCTKSSSTVLRVFDVQTAQPKMIGNYTNHDHSWFSSFALSNNFAFLAGEKQVTVLDISRATPSFITSFNHNFSPLDSIGAQNKYIYLCGIADDDKLPTFQIVDMTDEKNPHFRGWLKYNWDHPTFGDIVALEKYAYFIRNSPLWDAVIDIVDVSNPKKPVPVDESFTKAQDVHFTVLDKYLFSTMEESKIGVHWIFQTTKLDCPALEKV